MSTAGELILQRVDLDGMAQWGDGVTGVIFLFPKEGQGRYAARTFSQDIVAGDMLVANASVEGRLTSVGKEGLKALYFYANLESLAGLFTSAELCHLNQLCEDFMGVRFYAAGDPSARECHAVVDAAPTDATLEHRWHLLRAVAALFGPVLGAAITRGQQDGLTKAHMLKVLDQLTPAELQHLSVKELAQRFGCGRRHLNRLFQEHFGTSVAALKMEMRLLKAVILLRNPSAKVINVAGECGFTHLGLFNTCFKRRFGVNPTEWRRQNAGVEPGSEPDGVRLRSNARSCQLRARGLCPWAKGHPTIAEA